jgi:hypothetical protein
MVASRARAIGAYYTAPFWFSAFCGALLPTSIGYQDLAALLARGPGVAQSWREHLIASPFGTIEAATFRYARPIGTAMPRTLYQTVSYDPSSPDANSWRTDDPLTVRPAQHIEYPTVNRRLKGDRLPMINTPSRSAAPQPQPVDARPSPPPPTVQPSQSSPPAMQPVPPALPPSPVPVLHLKNAELYDDVLPIAAPARPLPSMPALSSIMAADIASGASTAQTAAAPPDSDAENGVAMNALSGPERDNASRSVGDDDSAVADKPPEIPSAGETNAAASSLSFIDDDPTESNAQIYFGVGALGSPSGLESWAPGAQPILASPAVESGIKLSALEGVAADTDGGGETVAKKNDGALLESPAQRLDLAGKPRARAEKCLADAVYFEARGEPYKGQEAVAQVVMNRVFSGYYPHDVCGVVYQNASRYLACQFTFACERKDLNRIDEPDMWEQAKQIAKDTLDGKIWLAEVGHATHYHAYWVHPSWVNEMTKLYKLGVHTFYRPRAWGDGSDDWGPTEINAETTRPDPEVLRAKPEPAPKNPDSAAKGQAEAAPANPAAAKDEPTAKL